MYSRGFLQNMTETIPADSTAIEFLEVTLKEKETKKQKAQKPMRFLDFEHFEFEISAWKTEVRGGLL